MEKPWQQRARDTPDSIAGIVQENTVVGVKTDRSHEAGRCRENPFNAIVVGGSSGMGFAAAQHFLARGGRVLLCSRSQSKLDAAKKRLDHELLALGSPVTAQNEEDGQGRVQTRVLDNTDEAQVRAFFGSLEGERQWDALVVTALGRAPHGPFLELDVARAREAVEGKLWGPWYCAKYGAPKLRDGGAIVFCSGVLCRRPGLNCTVFLASFPCARLSFACGRVKRSLTRTIAQPLVAGNGGVEALTKALALELGPRLRVNCLAPGFFDTERYDHLPASRKDGMLEATADSLPLKTIGAASEAGAAIIFLATSGFTTGVVLDIDGGHQIRQYSYPNDVYLQLKRQREATAAGATPEGECPVLKKSKDNA